MRNNLAKEYKLTVPIFFIIRPPLKLLPVLGPLERYVTSTLEAALLCSSMAGSDLGHMSDWFEELYSGSRRYHIHKSQAGFNPHKKNL